MDSVLWHRCGSDSPRQATKSARARGLHGDHRLGSHKTMRDWAGSDMTRG